MMLDVQGLRTAYGRIPILNGVGFAVREGEFVGILGHNGMGKTTLLKALMGFLPATSGRVHFAGSDITAAEPYRPACYFGAVKALVDWTATTGAAFAFCQLVASEAGGPTCYHALGEEIATLLASLPEREVQCLRAQEPQAVMACRLGAGVPVSR